MDAVVVAGARIAECRRSESAACAAGAVEVRAPGICAARLAGWQQTPESVWPPAPWLIGDALRSRVGAAHAVDGAGLAGRHKRRLARSALAVRRAALARLATPASRRFASALQLSAAGGEAGAAVGAALGSRSGGEADGADLQTTLGGHGSPGDTASPAAAPVRAAGAVVAATVARPTPRRSTGNRWQQPGHQDGDHCPPAARYPEPPNELVEGVVVHRSPSPSTPPGPNNHRTPRDRPHGMAGGRAAQSGKRRIPQPYGGCSAASQDPIRRGIERRRRSRGTGLRLRTAGQRGPTGHPPPLDRDRSRPCLLPPPHSPAV